MMVLGQYRAVPVGTWWNWDSMGRYWLVLGGAGEGAGGKSIGEKKVTGGHKDSHTDEIVKTESEFWTRNLQYYPVTNPPVEHTWKHTWKLFGHLCKDPHCSSWRRQALDILRHHGQPLSPQIELLQSWEKREKSGILFSWNVEWFSEKKLDISFEDIQHFSQLLGLVATHDSKQVLHSLQLVILQSTVD